MTVLVRSREIVTDHGSVHVEVDGRRRRSRSGGAGRDDITVQWFCGDERTFSAEDLEHALAHVKDSKGSDAWLELTDSEDEHVFVKLDGDELFASTGALGDTEAQSVPWKDLRKALKQTIKQSRR